MEKAFAVIGAGWGDEGKGLSVDAIAASLSGDVVVVRSNGGAQAGHGVHTPDGRHHVFHHIGSGSFTGARTHLSRFFVAHPMVFFQEMEDLKPKGAEPVITMDPRAQITTPWDMAINQSLEYLRGGDRHGSCGLGFGEAIERSERGYGLNFSDLSASDLEHHLRDILTHWVPLRMADMGLKDKNFPLREILEGKIDVIPAFLEDCRKMRAAIAMMDDARISEADHVIFEGAQGLQLDMDLGDFPFVTRSYTGLPNIIEIAREAGISGIDAIYVTRAYGTRHGVGPMPYEVGQTPPAFADVTDKTNLPNEWQGDIRYSLLDIDGLGRIIAKDIARAGTDIQVTPLIGVTCVDQIRGEAEMVRDGQIITVAANDIGTSVAGALGMEIGLLSRGPHRDCVSLSLKRNPESQCLPA